MTGEQEATTLTVAHEDTTTTTDFSRVDLQVLRIMGIAKHVPRGTTMTGEGTPGGPYMFEQQVQGFVQSLFFTLKHLFLAEVPTRQLDVL